MLKLVEKMTELMLRRYLPAQKKLLAGNLVSTAVTLLVFEMELLDNMKFKFPFFLLHGELPIQLRFIIPASLIRYIVFLWFMGS
jgi:hypothetical protein